MTPPETEEDLRQKRFLETLTGEPGSGAVRYAAAMYFFQKGTMGERELEIYRAQSKIDGVSPVTKLVAQAQRYIGALNFAGKADVMAGIARWAQGAPNMITPKYVPALSYLDAALITIENSYLAAAIKDASPLLRWVTYPYEGQEIGDSFPRNHAFATLLGKHGPFQASDFDLGLFLIAPHIFYRDHHHQAPELYAPLTGPHGWRFAPGAALEQLDAHAPVWNPSFRHHAILVGEVPFLAFYCWTRDVNEAARVIFSPDWNAFES